MKTILSSVVSFFVSTFRSRLSLQMEILALRHQLAVYQRAGKRPRLRSADRILWAWLARAWCGWREALILVQPQTVITWQRRRFRDYWRKLSQRSEPGRPQVAKDESCLGSHGSALPDYYQFQHGPNRTASALYEFSGGTRSRSAEGVSTRMRTTWA